MKKSSVILLFGVLIFIMLSSACTPTPTPGAATATPTPGTQPVSLTELCWFCVEGVSHIGVAIPAGATFEVVAAPAGLTCSSVEQVEGKQVVLCRGSEPTTFQLKVCSAGSCTEYPLTLQSCTASPAGTFTPTATATATLTATPSATIAASTPDVGKATATATPQADTSTSTPTPTATP